MAKAIDFSITLGEAEALPKVVIKNELVFRRIHATAQENEDSIVISKSLIARAAPVLASLGVAYWEQHQNDSAWHRAEMARMTEHIERTERKCEWAIEKAAAEVQDAYTEGHKEGKELTQAKEYDRGYSEGYEKGKGVEPEDPLYQSDAMNMIIRAVQDFCSWDCPLVNESGREGFKSGHSGPCLNCPIGGIHRFFAMVGGDNYKIQF